MNTPESEFATLAARLRRISPTLPAADAEAALASAIRRAVGAIAERAAAGRMPFALYGYGDFDGSLMNAADDVLVSLFLDTAKRLAGANECWPRLLPAKLPRAATIGATAPIPTGFEELPGRWQQRAEEAADVLDWLAGLDVADAPATDDTPHDEKDLPLAERNVLRVVRGNGGGPFTIEELVGLNAGSERTIGPAVKRLIDRGKLIRRHGPKGGVSLP